MTTTRGRGRDRTCARPTDGQQAELARAEHACRRSSSRSPVGDVLARPRGRAGRARGARVIRTLRDAAGRSTRTGRPRRRPAGIGAPVMILHRGAGRQREERGLAGADLADHRQVHRAVRRWRRRRRRGTTA